MRIWKINDAGFLPAAPPSVSFTAFCEAANLALWMSPQDDPCFDEHNMLALATSSRVAGEYRAVVPLPSFDSMPLLLTGDADLDALMAASATPPAGLDTATLLAAGPLPPLDATALSGGASESSLEEGPPPLQLLPLTSTAAVDDSAGVPLTALPCPAHDNSLLPASCGGLGSGCSCLHCAGFVHSASAAFQPATPLACPAEQTAEQQAASAAAAAHTPEPSDAAILAAVAAAPPASPSTAATAVAAAVAAPARRRGGGGGSSSGIQSQKAPIGLSWASQDFGTVIGWDGPTVVVCLRDGRRAKVPTRCPCCGVAPYTSKQWASGALTKKGAPKQNDPSNPRNGKGRCPDPGNVVSWLELHATHMSDDLMEFYHLLKSTLCRMRKKAGVKSPRSSKQKAAAGRGNRKDREAHAEAAPPAKRQKRRV